MRAALLLLSGPIRALLPVVSWPMLLVSSCPPPSCADVREAPTEPEIAPARAPTGCVLNAL
eukprot:4659214-Pyramimonas_sp.AAC.1